MTEPTSSLSPEDLETGIKVGRIFMPRAGDQIDLAYPDRAKSAKFVHYTSAEAGLKIIQTKRLWMRNTTCMADYREVHHGFDLFNAILSDKTRRADFDGALNACAPGIAQQALDFLNSHLQDIRYNTFVASISKHDLAEDRQGRLSMWRAFSPGATRVAIVINIPWFSGAVEHLKILFSPAGYLTPKELSDEFNSVVTGIKSNSAFLSTIDRNLLFAFIYQMLVAAITCLKHDGFVEEQEWRAVYGPNRFSSPLMERSTEIISGVPQSIYKIPLDKDKDSSLAGLDLGHIFDHLIIGPTTYAPAIYEAFVHELKAIGVEDAQERVWACNIPIRT